MRSAAIAVAVALVAVTAAGQMLECPGAAAASGRGCDAFHFHVQMYRPDTRGFSEFWGINQFASQAACERAREASMKRNLTVVDYFRRVRNETQYEPDRTGPCHCDLSLDKSNPRYLTDAQRTVQLRAAEDVRQRVRERLMDVGLTTDSEVVRSVAPAPLTPTPLLGGPKLVTIPQAAAVGEVSNSPDDLRSTRTIENARPTVATLDLPLVDVTGAAPVTAEPPPGAPAAAAAEAPAQATPAASPAPSNVAVEKPPAPTPEPASVAAAPAPAPTATTSSVPSQEEVATAEEAADAFISYETQRIQNVLKASATVGDESTKAKIFEACMQRIQLLSNLRTLIQSSGARSRLAAAARAAATESERLALISRLFGDSMKSHWAPADAKDVVVGGDSEADKDAEGILRDAGGKYTVAQRQRALYVLLARSQPTEDQQLWLTTVVDSLLK